MVLKFKRLHEVKFSNREYVFSCGQMSLCFCTGPVLVIMFLIQSFLSLCELC